MPSLADRSEQVNRHYIQAFQYISLNPIVFGCLTTICTLEIFQCLIFFFVIFILSTFPVWPPSTNVLLTNGNSNVTVVLCSQSNTHPCPSLPYQNLSHLICIPWPLCVIPDKLAAF